MSLYNSYYNARDPDMLRPDHMERLSFFSISAISVWLLVTVVFVLSLSRVSDRIKSWDFMVSCLTYY